MATAGATASKSAVILTTRAAGRLVDAFFVKITVG
jgi:hypothetical protein